MFISKIDAIYKITKQLNIRPRPKQYVFYQSIGEREKIKPVKV